METFLLPSLVAALLYLSDSLWAEPPSEQRAIIGILQPILQPSSISNEASTMHSAVLNIVAKPLEHSLRAYQRQNPKSQDVEPLLKALKENIPLSRRTGAADHNELEAWAGTQNGGLAAAIRHTVQSFVQWSQHPGVSVMPTVYSHRQFLAALKIMDAPQVLQLLLEEVKHQTESGSGSIAYDVACALVCAPDATNDPDSQPMGIPGESAVTLPNPIQRRVSLREALRSAAEDWRKIQKRDPVMAETVVRLYRKVEAQMTAQPPPPIMPASLELDASATLDEAIAAATAPGEPLTIDTADFGIEGSGADLGMGSATNSAGGYDLGDDLFSGIGGLDWDIT